MSTLARVRLWGTTIGAVTLPGDDRVAAFEYDPAFVASGIELSPFQMPLRAGRVYRFPALSPESFAGLPGLLADSLPDRYGNALIDAWLATRNREPESFDAVERLCYVGKRGMSSRRLTALVQRPATSLTSKPWPSWRRRCWPGARTSRPRCESPANARPCGRSSALAPRPGERAQRR